MWLLCAITSGGATSNHHVRRPGQSAGTCHAFIVIDPKIFGDPDAIKAHLSAYLEELRNSPKADGQDRIYTHGEKEVEAVAKMMKDGIPVNDNTMVEVLDLCNYLKMDFSKYFGDYQPPVETGFKGNFY